MTALKVEVDTIKVTKMWQGPILRASDGKAKLLIRTTAHLQFFLKFKTRKTIAETLEEKNLDLGVTQRIRIFDGSTVTFQIVSVRSKLSRLYTMILTCDTFIIPCLNCVENETFEDVVEVKMEAAFNFMEFIHTKEFIFFCVVGFVILSSLIVMCVVCIASTSKKIRRSPGYNRAATQVRPGLEDIIVSVIFIILWAINKSIHLQIWQDVELLDLDKLE